MKKVDLSNFPFSRYTDFTFSNYVIDLEVSDYDKTEKTGFIEKSKLKDYEILNENFANQCFILNTSTLHKNDRYTSNYDSDMIFRNSDIFTGKQDS